MTGNNNQQSQFVHIYFIYTFLLHKPVTQNNLSSLITAIKLYCILGTQAIHSKV